MLDQIGLAALAGSIRSTAMLLHPTQVAASRMAAAIAVALASARAGVACAGMTVTCRATRVPPTRAGATPPQI
jgi:hypothetical protein